MREPFNILFLLRKVDCNDGIASYCQALAEGLTARGVAVFMISGQIYNDSKTLTRRRALEACLAQWWSIPGLKQIPHPGHFIKLALFIRKKNISVINVHGLGMLLWGKLLSILTRVPLIATYHPSVAGDLNGIVSASLRPFTYRQKLFLRLFSPDRLIVLSEESKNFLELQCPTLRRGTVKIHGGIDDQHFRPPSERERLASRARFGLTDSDMVCLLVGRMNWNKGQDLLIKAVREIRRRKPGIDLKCFFVGGGSAAQDIEALAFIDEEDRKTFTFLGYVESVREVMWAADMFVLPSRLEGFALVIAEAMSTGLVPIRTPSGGAADQIIEGKTGLIVPFENVDALADAIVTLTDVDTRNAMVRNCLALAKSRFSRDAMADRTIALMRDVV